MTDYTKATGTSGTLIIRDTGTIVEAIIVCNNGATYADGKSWSLTAGGGSASGSFSISGAESVTVWSGSITSTLTVTFTMGATGTSGLGGPTTISATINRATVPAAPTSLGVDMNTMTSLRFRFSGGSNGGATVDQYQLAYGTNSAGPTAAGNTTITSTGTSTLSNLIPGTTYYFWARAHNSVGWGAYSARASGATLSGARVRVSGAWVTAVPYVKVSGVWKIAIPYVKVGGVWTQTK